MLAGFKETLDSIISLLNDHELQAHYYEEEDGRFFIRINEMMCDPGLAYDNIALDMFFDENEKVLFIGLLRLPATLRKSGLGSRIVKLIKNYADEHHFYIYVDACNDSQPFWTYKGFKHMFYDRNYFDMMGYSGDNEDIFLEWEAFKRTNVFHCYLECHSV
ncbi:N-acetyltransferase [Anaerobacillus sp. MEB173]|uniref:GNAT family N-acetyltransferase n=1 Tax=Anaerobacillus sp. MEB173 TaxID=3383345 RepID=UPI003F903F70